MLLPDWFWELRGHAIVEPARADETLRVNPTSVDLTLDTSLLLQRYRGREYPNTRAFLSTKQGYLGSQLHIISSPYKDEDPFAPFEPGDSVLASTRETLHVPRWLRLQGMLKSSLAREGLNHRTALYIDPGFDGTITLELEFARSGYLMPTQPIIQIEGVVVFPRLTYKQRSGHYQGQSGPRPNRNPDIAFQAVMR